MKQRYDVHIVRDDTGIPTRLEYGPILPGYESPWQKALRDRYATARKVWQDNPNVQEAAAMIGMSEREYCDRYLCLYPPMMYTTTTTSVGPMLDYDRAYREAKL